MLDKAFGRILGHANGLILSRAANQLPILVEDLLQDALTLWSGNGWYTFDRLESNCSGQLYRWLKEAKRADARFSPLVVTIENVELTPAMLAGTQSVVGASRPDLRIHVGESGVLLEAKRLTNTARHCRAYVEEGMARFVSSAYGARSDWGLMLGYVQDATVAVIEPRVNGFVNTHAIMGEGHQLVPQRADAISARLRSSHARASGLPIVLDHVWIRLP